MNFGDKPALRHQLQSKVTSAGPNRPGAGRNLPAVRQRAMAAGTGDPGQVPTSNATRTLCDFPTFASNASILPEGFPSKSLTGQNLHGKSAVESVALMFETPIQPMLKCCLIFIPLFPIDETI
ncbi:MAG: hypothetical protein HY288_03090 [Planctomycetia bacterium]|nr:hypothetical protein [Planctomycetia bacterium]